MSDSAAAHLGLAWLAHRTGRDLQRAARLAGGPSALWSLTDAGLSSLAGLGPEGRAQVRSARGELAGALAALTRSGITSAGWEEAGYPARLRDIHDPPFGLFREGGLLPDQPAQRPVIAVVGARRAGAVGLALARRIGFELASRGAVVASGLALGIDAAAHAGALDAGGDTIAVVGCGVDLAYPRRNRGIYDAIVARGCVVSEYWPGTEPAPWRFPARNRILAGMSDAVVVIEAGTRSGSLITADFALEIGRAVLAVPGPPGAPGVAGCHALLRAGAALCESVEDVVNELPDLAWAEPVPQGEKSTGVARLALTAIQGEGLTPDELARRLSRPIPEIAGVLALLELDGLAVREAGRFHAVPGQARG